MVNKMPPLEYQTVITKRKFDAQFIYLSVGAVEWQLEYFATILLHPAPVKVISVLVLFALFRGLF